MMLALLRDARAQYTSATYSISCLDTMTGAGIQAGDWTGYTVTQATGWDFRYSSDSARVLGLDVGGQRLVNVHLVCGGQVLRDSHRRVGGDVHPL